MRKFTKERDIQGQQVHRSRLKVLKGYKRILKGRDVASDVPDTTPSTKALTAESKSAYMLSLR